MEKFEHIFEYNPTKPEIAQLIEKNMGDWMRSFFRNVFQPQIDLIEKNLKAEFKRYTEMNHFPIKFIEQLIKDYTYDYLNHLEVTKIKQAYEIIEKHEKLLVKKITQLEKKIEALEQK